MDVPFHSSNAMSRAHYAIVRKVESASSPQSADQDLFLEMKSIEGQLLHPKLSLAKCKECLVMLLYCSTSVTPGFLPTDAFEFSFHHAINLAETGKRVDDKRIGYLFCAEIMPLDHDLRLMLINTLRKDLESDEIPRICLALDNLINSPTEDIIPAVQSRLHDLLSHDHAPVRRRALFAFRALSKYNIAMLERIHKTVIKRLKDPDVSVVQAALTIAGTMPDDNAIVSRVNEILVTESAYINGGEQDIILSILKTLRSLRLSESNIPILFDILQEYSAHKNPILHSKAVVMEIFLLFSRINLSLFLSIEGSKKMSAIRCIRHFLTSRNPNDVHLFMSCLECIDVSAWAGTTPDKAAALDGLEFERIMQLLNSVDESLRKKTLRIITRVDSSILDGHVEALLKNAAAEPTTLEAVILRTLEVRLIQYREDGGEYAREILEILRRIDETIPEAYVFKGAIEVILTELRVPHDPGFVTACAAHVITVLSESDVPLGPTALIVATALATEFSGAVSTSPLHVLSALAVRVRVCPAIVQEPCIIAMLRVSAECEQVPSDVIDAITTLSQTARRSIRSRCTEFLEYSQHKDQLLKIIREAESPSLPDFLVSLQRHKSELASRPPVLTPPISRTSSRASAHASTSLRYAAYAASEAIPPLRTRKAPKSPPSAYGSPARTLSGFTNASNASVSPTISAGQLALAAGFEELSLQPLLSGSLLGPTGQIDTMMAKTDLISLENPFEEEPQPLDISEIIEREDNFEDIWNQLHAACDMRGWCSASIDTVTRKLQRLEGHHLRVISSDVLPFIGELKVLVIPNENTPHTKPPRPIAFRLRESEDDSCLWRLRCGDGGVGEHMQSILNA